MVCGGGLRRRNSTICQETLRSQEVFFQQFELSFIRKREQSSKVNEHGQQARWQSLFLLLMDYHRKGDNIKDIVCGTKANAPAHNSVYSGDGCRPVLQSPDLVFPSEGEEGAFWQRGFGFDDCLQFFLVSTVMNCEKICTLFNLRMHKKQKCTEC